MHTGDVCVLPHEFGDFTIGNFTTGSEILTLALYVEVDDDQNEGDDNEEANEEGATPRTCLRGKSPGLRPRLISSPRLKRRMKKRPRKAHLADGRGAHEGQGPLLTCTRGCGKWLATTR
jgi:hypothetical protein